MEIHGSHREAVCADISGGKYYTSTFNYSIIWINTVLTPVIVKMGPSERVGVVYSEDSSVNLIILAILKQSPVNFVWSRFSRDCFSTEGMRNQNFVVR